jgi:hypothetical protein
MPWESEEFLPTIIQSKNIIEKEFGIRPNAAILLCTYEELSQTTIFELTKKKYSQEKLKFLKKYIIPKIIGKYFAKSNEIWLIDGKGTNFPTLIHEMIHSIQNCAPNREHIVDYITYRILKKEAPIEQNVLLEWTEIESSHKFSKIKKQILSDGDCEDF